MVKRRLHDAQSDLPHLALALITLALVGFSLVLVCQMAWLSTAQRTDFAARNTLGEHARSILLLSLGGGLALPAVLGLRLVLRERKGAAVPSLERLAMRLAPLGVLFIVPGLFLSAIAREKPLYYLVVLSTFGLIFDALLVRSLEIRASARVASWLARLRRLSLVRAFLAVPRGAPLILLLLAAALCAFLLVHYGVAHHRLIQNTGEYLGVPDNVLANLRHGRFFKAPLLFGADSPGNYLTVHAEYGSLLFVPLYALRPGAETLLWLQASIAALAAVPLYFLAAHKLGRGLGTWAALVYLLTAPLHGALVGGFSWLHAVTLFSFTLYYAVETDRRWFIALSLVLLLSISEVGPLNVFCFGLMSIAARRKARLGFLLCALSLPLIVFNFWLSARGKVDVPAMLETVRALGRNPAYFVWDLARVVKLTPIFHALGPLCLLPALELSCWPLLLPGVLFVSSATVFWPDSPAGFANALVWLPGCFLALLVVLEKRRLLGRGRAPLAAAVIALSVTVLSHSYNYGALLREDGFGGIPPEEVRVTAQAQLRYGLLQRALREIPAQASVAATSHLVSFVSNRPEACDLVRPCGRPDYLLLSSRETGAVRSQVGNLFAMREYRLVLGNLEEFYLFQRSPETLETRDAIVRLGLASN